MAALIHLDTHVAAWLYAGLADRLPMQVRKRLDREEILISPAVELELQYLFETGRTGAGGAAVVEELRRRIGLQVCAEPFGDVVQVALTFSWTRDPFDRLIVAQSALASAPLATKDRLIRDNHRHALWT